VVKEVIQRIKEDLTELLMAPILMEEITIIEELQTEQVIVYKSLSSGFNVFIIRIFINRTNSFGVKFRIPSSVSPVVSYDDYDEMFDEIKKYIDGRIADGEI